MTTKKLLRVCAVALVVGSGGGGVGAEAQTEVDSQVDPGLELQVSPAPEPQHELLQSLGISPNAADVWSLQCGLGTVYAQADVRDTGGRGDGVTLRVTLVNPRGRAATQLAPDGGTSPPATLNTGPGNYLVIFTKSSVAPPPAVESYASFQTCLDAAGGFTPHSVVLVQNQ